MDILIDPIVRRLREENKERQMAQYVLDQFLIFKAPVNILEIMKHIGIPVLKSQFPGESNKILGMFNVKEEAICVNENELSTDEGHQRIRFVIACLLGLYILHPVWLKSSDNKPIYRTELFYPRNEKDQDAAVFAHHLMVPQRLLKRYLKSSFLSTLSHTFAVPPYVITNQIHALPSAPKKSIGSWIKTFFGS